MLNLLQNIDNKRKFLKKIVFKGIKRVLKFNEFLANGGSESRNGLYLDDIFDDNIKNLFNDFHLN